MRILAITNMFPSAQHPSAGQFIKQQIKGLRNIDIEVEIFLVDRLQKGKSAYWGLGQRIKRKIEASQPHLVHCMYGGIMAEIATRSNCAKPVIVTYHGSDLLGENQSGLFRKIFSLYGVWASKLAAQRAAGLVVVAPDLETIIKPYADNSKIRIIPCGIDLDLFRPLNQEECCRQLDWDPHKFNVLFQRSRDPVKRPALAHASVDALKKLGVPAQLHELQNVPYDQVPLWLNASGALLLTSFHEGSPTIVKEALSCDVPVVSVDVGDVGERIKGIEGCYLASSTPEDLANKLLAVSIRGARVNGRASMESLSITNVALCLKEFYDEVIQRSINSSKI